MKKLTLLAVALFCMAAQANAANLTGTWKGTGRAVDNQGKPINCESVVVAFNQTAANLTVNSTFTCGGSAVTLPSATFDIRGSDLLDNGAKAGTLTDSTVSVLAKSKGYTMQSNASFNASEMNLRSVVSVGANPAPAFTFEAVIRR